MRKTKLWKNNWNPVADSKWQRSGGQGRLRLLQRRDDPNSPLAVLKELKNQTDPDRRRRMRREIATLETLPHPSTPSLLEHNTQHFCDPSIELYSVFDFIPGPTLREYVTSQGPLSLDDSLSLVCSLLEIVGFYHAAGIGHRDIKPENIILRNGTPLSPVLIDFGLTFNISESPSEDTPDWQQVGNRFLTLPEHAAFSANKRDLRSDISFCVAILFFALTGSPPSTLSDEEGRLPHQRPSLRAKLDEIPTPQRRTLLHLFDTGFALNLAYRWQNINALQIQIQRITAQVTEENCIDTFIADIRAHSDAKRGNMAIKDMIDQTRARLKVATLTAIKKIGPGYESNIEERLTKMDDMSSWIRCGVLHVYDGRLTNTYYSIRAIGDELVISEFFDRKENKSIIVDRIPLEASAPFSQLETTVERRIIENVHQSIESC